MIHLLWPTIRPAMMMQTLDVWKKTASKPGQIKVKVAVNTHAERQALSSIPDVIIVGSNRRGPVYATHCLAQQVQADMTDLIILASDDFYPPTGWDTFLTTHAQGFEGGLLVNDGYQVDSGNVMTLPILTMGCLLKLNRIIYHPSYQWQFSDDELGLNLMQTNMMKRLRGSMYPIFQHRHWANNLRKADEHAKFMGSCSGSDQQNWFKRRVLSLQDRLKV
jgi:hypothetical protein